MSLQAGQWEQLGPFWRARGWLGKGLVVDILHAAVVLPNYCSRMQTHNKYDQFEVLEQCG